MYLAIRILVHQPVTLRLFEDFFVERLVKESIDVLFYDLTGIFHPRLNTANELQSELVVKFEKIEEFELQIKNDRKQNILYIPYFIYEYKVLNVYRILTNYDCYMAFMGRGMLPFPNVNKSLVQLLIGNARSLVNFGFMKRGVRKLYANWLKRKGFIKKFDIIFNAGHMGHYTSGTNFEYESARLVPFNSTDYTRYLKSTKSSFSIAEPQYAVFLDEYLPFHPDVQMIGMKSVQAESYFSELNAFFSSLEDSLNVKVVVAAHPKSDYQVNPYGGRSLIKNQTENLIREATFVIDHFSTAISYAVLNRKPIVIIYTSEMKMVFPNLVKYAENVSCILGSEIINITKEKRIKRPLTIDSNRYNHYKYNYLTMPSAENTADEDLFVEFIKSNHVT